MRQLTLSLLIDSAKRACPRFIGYALARRHLSMQSASMRQGIDRQARLPRELRDLVIALPPAPSKQRIAAFLDRRDCQDRRAGGRAASASSSC